MTKRTVVLSSATGMLLVMFSSMIDAQNAEKGDVHNVYSARLDNARHIDTSATAVGDVELITLVKSLPAAEIPTEFTPYARLLELSGFSAQLNKVPDAVRSSIESVLLDGMAIEPFELADAPFLRREVPAAFSTQTLYTAVLAEMQALMSDESVNQLIQFYSTLHGEKLRDAETNNSILENTDRFKVWFATQGIASLSPEKQSALTELEQAMQATEGAVDAMIGMQVAMQVSLTPVLPKDQQRSAADLMRAAQYQRPGLTRIYRKSSLETLGFVFQAQSIDELRAYSAILNTEAGQNYVVALNNGLSRGLITAAENLGQSIQTLLTGRLGQGV